MAVVVVLGATATTVGLGVRTTAGWVDQSRYHWPTVATMIDRLPAVDVVDVQTATGPLYHLSLAVPARLLGLSEGGVEVLAALYGAVLAALVVGASRGLTTAPRIGAVGLVLLSPYLWESTLWMQTDAAAMTFALAALLLLVRAPQARHRHALWVGLLVAGAVGVRQTFGWMILVAAVGLWFTGPTKTLRARLADVAAGTLPGVAVLVGLVAAWRGLLPPAMASSNADHRSPAGLTYMFALAAWFLVPLVVALGRDVWGRRRDWPLALGTGLVAAVPGLLFPSSELGGDDLPRSGGWLWVLVSKTPAPGDRSVLLVVLALVGGAAFALLLLRLVRTGSGRVAAVLGVALVGAALFASAGSQMYQKYYETPLVIIVFFLLRALFAGAAPGRTTVLAAWPAVLQAGALAALVLLPVARALAA